jgi:nitrite reductase/ring-hydroxylating ferredoxin subunit
MTDKIQRGAEDSGRYFKYMADFVGFGADEAAAIHESRLIIEKYIPEIVSRFYQQLLTYPPTRKFFLRADGSLDQDYLQMRMHHLANFWRRTASGVFDDEYARYVDYVGRAHTMHGADPNIYIPERYVIGQVGFIQHAISQAISRELHEIDPDWEVRAQRAWSLLMMVILEMLSRAYGHEREPESYPERATVDREPVLQLAVEAYEMALGMRTSQERKDVPVCPTGEIPEGERKIVEIDGLSIGIFHHQGNWYALKNSCLHRGGPVCSGALEDDVLTCPWHGYQYNLTDGKLLSDPSAALESYPVEVVEGLIHLKLPTVRRDAIRVTIEDSDVGDEATELKENEFLVDELQMGQITLVERDGSPVAVYNVAGQFFATSDECTHAQGPLSDGRLEGEEVICPWHFSRFNVKSGAAARGPASVALKTYTVVIEGKIGRVEG